MEAIVIPLLDKTPAIDGDLGEWKLDAFSDGEWDMARVKASPWYEPKRNRLVVDSNEVPGAADLRAAYYLAWDGHHLYFGAEVHDNVNDVMDAKHEPKRWYYKDAIALFIEAPRDGVAEKFEEGDHAFCFVMDNSKPDYGAWWRHGSATEAYIEEPIPTPSVDYALQMNPWGENPADYIFEGRIDVSSTLALGMEKSKAFAENEFSFMIVHCDPDGGEYGGHLLIYGKGDNDATWTRMKFEHAGQH
ncbi:MAG: sugar-binding protein [Cryomorphaceae bacterium]